MATVSSTFADPELSDEDRIWIGRSWRDAARTELDAGFGYAKVVTELYELGAETNVLSMATKAAHEEVRHAQTCRELAEHYLGEPVSMPTPRAVTLPEHKGADETLRKHLHVVGLSCINESLAVTFAETCLRGATYQAVLPSLKAHLQDEINHARVGWAHLASSVVDSARKEDIAKFVPRLLRANLAQCKSRMMTFLERGIPSHGFPPRQQLLDAADDTVRNLIVPGFEAVGIPLRL